MPRISTPFLATFSTLAIGLLLAGCDGTVAQLPQVLTSTGQIVGSDDWKIDNARSAAPMRLSSGATILDWPQTATGAFTVLWEGSNDWSCMPDDPSTPGNDPVCVDRNAMEWFGAYMARKAPDLTQPGIGYMLQGGSEASNTDPFAREPASGESWMASPPHIMVFPAGSLDAAAFGTDPMNGGPWIMWDGTPYEHLMIPVTDEPL